MISILKFLAVSCIILGIPPQGVLAESRCVQDLGEIEMRVAEAEQARVLVLLDAYLEGRALVGPDHPAVIGWLDRLLHETDAAALSSALDPFMIRRKVEQTGAGSERLIAELVLKVWSRLQHELASMSSPIVYLNVAPPPESGAPSGIVPNAIEDIALRAEYEQAIQENHFNAFRLRNRVSLERKIEQYAEHAVSLFRTLYSGNQDETLKSIQESDIQNPEKLIDQIRKP